MRGLIPPSPGRNRVNGEVKFKNKFEKKINFDSGKKMDGKSFTFTAENVYHR